MTNSPIIFDRRRLRLHKARALRMGAEDFLLKEMAVRASERLVEINKEFPVALELGGSCNMAGKHGIKKLIHSMPWPEWETRNEASRQYIVADEEFLPMAEHSIDLCISLSSLHFVNDLPGALIQINRALRPGGLLVAILPGGQTLKELRQSFERAEMEYAGGVSPRVSPFVDVKDAGSLLQRAGFSHPVADSEMLTLEYNHPLKLLKDLRKMGETNILIHSKKSFTPCSLMMLMADHYMQHFTGESGRIQATIELVTLTAWK